MPCAPWKWFSRATAVENSVGPRAKSKQSPGPSGSQHNASSTSRPPRAERGIQVLHDVDDATIDIVGVHGLASNPDYSWVWDPKNNPPGQKGYPSHYLNWLQELLPKGLASSNISCRIMVFNYDSQWLSNAPQQSVWNIAVVLLENISRVRKNARNRPLIFIGHGFGGTVIEQAIISSRQGSMHSEVAASTAGVVFLGTPHRGCRSATWAKTLTSLAILADCEDRLVESLQEESDEWVRRLDAFSEWLRDESVPVVCFFETLKTAPLRIRGVKSDQITGLIVPEQSACIDVSIKIALQKDHSKLNKYFGEDDPAYELVLFRIEEIARKAPEAIFCRRNPRAIPKFQDLEIGDLRNCLREMRVANPQDVLSEIQSRKEKRVGQTCDWILKRDEFSSWAAGNNSQFLRIVGPPGIGKTMMATYIVNTITTKVEKSPGRAFAYFFCDDKGGEDRRMPTAILRSLIWQLLLQNNDLFRHLQPDFDKHNASRVFEELFQNFTALWRIFLNMLQDKQAGEVFILIDALDECDRDSRRALLTGMHDLFSPLSGESSGRVKFLVTCRPGIHDIEMKLKSLGVSLTVDSAMIKEDLEKYIEWKIQDLVRDKPGLKESEGRIRHALKVGTGGTFLWVSLMVAEIGRPEVLNYQVEKLLNRPPPQLDGIYASILNKIPPDHRDIAGFILHCMVAAKRPLTETEMKIAYATSLLPLEKTRQRKVPRQNDVQAYNDILSACSSILTYSHGNVPCGADKNSAILSFCHQSVKDFLLKDSSRANQEWYATTMDKANLLLLQTCWKYLTADDCLLAKSIMRKPKTRGPLFFNPPRDPHAGPHPERTHVFGNRAMEKQSEYMFLFYVWQMWEKHAMSSYPAVKEARSGQVEMLKLLHDNGAVQDMTDASGKTALSLGAGNGHAGAVEHLLATAEAEINLIDYAGRTPLSRAAEHGHVDVVKQLLATGKINIDVNLFHATPLILAVENGHLDVVKELLMKGAKIDLKGNSPRVTPLFVAARTGRVAMVKELLMKGAKIDSKHDLGNTPLYRARHRTDVVELLRARGADIDSMHNRDAESTSDATSGEEDAEEPTPDDLFSVLGDIPRQIVSRGQVILEPMPDRSR